MHAGARPTSQIMHTETFGARHVLQGRMMLLLGPPGGGKTTLLNALAGKLHSSKGLRVRVILSSTAAPVVPSHAPHTISCCTHDARCHSIHTVSVSFKPPKP